MMIQFSKKRKNPFNKIANNHLLVLMQILTQAFKMINQMKHLKYKNKNSNKPKLFQAIIVLAKTIMERYQWQNFK